MHSIQRGERMRIRIRKRTRRTALVAATLLPVSALMAACGSASSASSSATTSGSQALASSSSGPGKGISIDVIGGMPSDPFWSSVKRGGEEAAKLVEAAGGKVTFLQLQNYNNLGPDAAKLEQTALAQSPSAVVGPDWVPSAQNAAWKQITGKGIPVFLYNAGGTAAASAIGAIKYIGSDDYTAGKAGGAAFAAAGAKNVLCINTLPGATNSEARCKGIAAGEAAAGGKSTELPLPSSNFGNPSAVAQAIKAALLQNPSVDGVVTIGVSDADSAASALKQANLTGKVKLGTFDLSMSQLQRIKAGTQLFAIDQQPYLQGFYAVIMAFQYLEYGVLPPQNPMLTGPLIVNSSNVNKAIAGAKAGVR